MRRNFIFGILIILGFTAYGLSSFLTSMTPYISIEEAKRTQDVVQVKGVVVEESVRFVDGRLEFILGDGKDEMKVVYIGEIPQNFKDATSIVAIGTYKDGIFEALNLLVKCPSKYEGGGGG
ncbi:MAG: cytochrome c maturation protein CcmE [Candidatus Methanofastidiosia archaeon]